MQNVVQPNGQQTTIWCMHIVCWIPKLLLFHCNNGCKNAPQYYVIRTLPVLANILFYFIDYIKFSERANKINENPCFDSQAFLTYYELL